MFPYSSKFFYCLTQASEERLQKTKFVNNICLQFIVLETTTELQNVTSTNNFAIAISLHKRFSQRETA